ncbi:MAG: cobalamin biosynthesis protein CbiX [Betaproteobacteria bacterium]|nr:cobalamin biosynthesis protein CbiX [Betaproteobacteria bacterium]
MSKRHLVLFAHGARDPEWARPLEALRERVAALAPECAVSLAFLEFMSPGLVEAVTASAGQGAASVTIVPVFLAQGGHLKRDLPLMVTQLRAAHPALRIDVQPAIGEQPAVIEAIAACVAKVTR